MINKEICKYCNIEMIIDEWNGWIWTCYMCDYVGRYATYKEIEEYEGNLKCLKSQQ